jgi:antitoxin VapB
MGLNIKNAQVVRLVAEVASLTGESKTEAIRVALVERQKRLVGRGAGKSREQRLRRFLETEVWTSIPPEQLGRPPTRDEIEAILGFDEMDGES